MISVRMMKYTEENNQDGRRVVTSKEKRQSGGWDTLVKSLNKFSDDFMSTGRSQKQIKRKVTIQTTAENAKIAEVIFLVKIQISKSEIQNKSIIRLLNTKNVLYFN